MPSSLRLADYSDRELLWVISDLADDDGWVTVARVALEIDLDHPNPTLCVSSRFSWLKRYGALERQGKKWRLSPPGRALMTGKLDERQERLVEQVKPDQLLMLTRAVGKRYTLAGQTASSLMRREWLHTTKQAR